jgi:hypothetical protein
MTSQFNTALDAQQNYLKSLYDSSTFSSSVTGDLAGVQTDISNVMANLSSTTTGQYNVLTQQENVKRILDRENARLNQKKTSMDTIINGQQRLSALNYSYTERYKAYNRIILWTIAFFAIMVLVIGLSYYLPEGVIMILYIIFISLYILYVVWAFWDIWRRDSLNFEKLGSQGGLLSKGQATSSSTRYNSVYDDLQTMALDNLGYCTGKTCCSTGTYYDVSSGTCLVGDASENNIYGIDGSNTTITSAFTTIAEAYARGELPLGAGAGAGVGSGQITAVESSCCDNKKLPFSQLK